MPAYDYTFEYVQNAYGVPAEPGGRVRHREYGFGRLVPTGQGRNSYRSHHSYLIVQFDDQDKLSGPFHPTDENLEYLNEAGAVIWPIKEDA
jgi:hypothetical protein